MTIEVRQSLSEWDLINRDPTLCAVTQDLADAYNLDKGDELRIWNKENGAIRHFQIFRISTKSFDQGDMRIRLSLDGRSRFWSFYETHNSGEKKLLETGEDPWNAFGGAEEISNFRTWSNYSDNGTTINNISNVPDTFESRVQFLRGKTKIPVLVNIRQSLSEWNDVIGWEERCAISKSLADALGLEERDNIVLRHADRKTKRVAPYTIHRIYDTNEISNETSYTVRMSYVARKRLNNPNYDKGISDDNSIPNEFPAWLRFRCPVGKWRNQEEALATDRSRCFNITRITQTSNIIVATPHSGGIEINTFDVGEKIVDLLDCSWWNFSAHQLGGGTFNRWHITSADMNNAFSGLQKVKNRQWEYCISIHGYDGKVSGDPLLIGGRGPKKLKKHIAWYLDDYLPNDRRYDIAIAFASDEWSNYNGYRTENFVNYLTKNGDGGIQYELPRDCRENDWKEVAQATARAMKTWNNPHKEIKSKDREVEP